MDDATIMHLCFDTVLNSNARVEYHVLKYIRYTNEDTMRTERP